MRAFLMQVREQSQSMELEIAKLRTEAEKAQSSMAQLKAQLERIEGERQQTLAGASIRSRGVFPEMQLLLQSASV